MQAAWIFAVIIIWFCQSSETFRCVIRLYQSMWLGFACWQLRRGVGPASLVVHVHMHAELWPVIKSALLNSKTSALSRTVLVGPQGEGRGTLLLGIFTVCVHCLGKSDVRSVPCHTVPDTQCPLTLLPAQLSSDKAQALHWRKFTIASNMGCSVNHETTVLHILKRFCNKFPPSWKRANQSV